eukprot:TRINITY_DN2332_c0_g1_i1.p1 TRINITY_DN2332_c0_g1~~TRINITY_DN2332_c0_g1_i1.p1  ORF type:complete len:413 (-),score=72.01 TRINITY_DN2332_c0_g1_i1:329-1567(-)
MQSITENQLGLINGSNLTITSNPLSFSVGNNAEIIENQPTINLGTIGHVTHGKSTLVEALTSKKTAKYGEEKEKNMTIKLGYCNVKIFKCKCDAPECYSSGPATTKSGQKCDKCESPKELVRHISFVDCPGHEVLMATMLNGAAVMDAAFLLVAANQPCPQPQTREHLSALEMMGLRKVAVLQNKVDLVKPDRAKENFTEIRNFLSEKHQRQFPVIPISAQRRLNIDVICQYLANLEVPQRDLNCPPQMMVVRSFEVNQPGIEDPDKLVGGVAGGSLTKGVLRVGQKVEIRPGLIYMENDVVKCRPIKTTVTSISSEFQKLEYAVPGGLIGVGTNVDPSLAKSDRLVGHVIGVAGHLPEVYQNIVITYVLVDRVVNPETKTAEEVGDSKPLKKKEELKGIIVFIIVIICSTL